MKSSILNWTFVVGVALIATVLLWLYSDNILNSISDRIVNKYVKEHPILIDPADSVNVDSSHTAPIPSAITGQVGDTYGGTVGPVIAIIAAILTFMAFFIQFLANEQQRNYLKQQRFEDTFFRLLENHQKIVDSMDLRKKDHTTLSSSRDCFKTMFNRLKKDNAEQMDFDKINETYDKIQDRYKNDLHHYFRFLYHILKFIKNSDIKQSEKFRYAPILRAVLSPYELILIFYNGLHDFGNSHFKPLLEEFSFLKNMDESLLLNIVQKKEYDNLTFAKSEDRAKMYITWKQKQKRKKKTIGFSFYFDY